MAIAAHQRRAILVRLDDEPHRKLKVLAAQHGQSVQALMERYVEELLRLAEEKHGELRVLEPQGGP